MNHFSTVLRGRIVVMLLLSVALLATVLVTSPRSFAHANTSFMSATSQKAVNAADVVSSSLTSAMGKASILKRPGAPDCASGAFSKTLYGGAIIAPGIAWFAITCSVTTVMFGFQPDGNLVLYIGGQAKWATHTNVCTGGSARAAFQTDGNLVVYDCNNIARWSSGTLSGVYDMIVQDDGNVVMYSYPGIIGLSHVVWSTGTCCY